MPVGIINVLRFLPPTINAQDVPCSSGVNGRNPSTFIVSSEGRLEGTRQKAGTPRALAGTGGTSSKWRPIAPIALHRLKSLNSTRQYPQYPPLIFIRKKEV